MNGVHDMGGMHGFGPIEHEENEPAFHASWEGRVDAMNRAMGAWLRWNLDQTRFARESIPPAQYLRMSYYEKWFTALQAQMLDAGLITREELAAVKAAPGTPKATPAMPLSKIDLAKHRASFTRDVQVAPRFTLGDRVRTRVIHPTGHTRLPRYARGKTGVIARLHGVHVFPDTNAHGQGEQPCPLYAVRFEARELWGGVAAARDAVHLDLWERYLDPA